MDDVRWAKLEAKREQNRYFMGLERSAFLSQINPPKVKKERKRRWQDPCRSCGKAMRPPRTLKEDMPDTVRYGADGHCESCKRSLERRERGTAPRQRRDARPARCTECGWALRDKGRDADFPGTRRHHGKGVCHSCHYRLHRGTTGLPKKKVRHDGSEHCERCKVQLRGTTMTADELPGSVVVGKRVDGGWICKTCSIRERRANQPEPPRHTRRPMKCIDCGDHLRPSGSRAEDYPGTKRHNGGGRCIGCWERHREGGPRQKKLHKPPSNCVECSVELVPQRAMPGPGQKRRAGNGMCGKCKSKAYRAAG